MHAAEVGRRHVFDDDDPTVHRLQDRVAAMLGKEAALFVPSVTMSNQICLKAHTQPGDELLCEETSHVYLFEAGGPAVHSGVTCRTLEGDFGILDLSQLEDKIRDDNEHMVRTRLVCLENTHNCGGGRIYPARKIQAISALEPTSTACACTLDEQPASGTPSSPAASAPPNGPPRLTACQSASARDWALRSVRAASAGTPRNS